MPQHGIGGMGEWEQNSRFGANADMKKKPSSKLFICVSLSFRIYMLLLLLVFFFLCKHLLIPSSLHIRARIHFSIKCTMCEFDGWWDLIQGWIDVINHGDVMWWQCDEDGVMMHYFWNFRVYDCTMFSTINVIAIFNKFVIKNIHFGLYTQKTNKAWKAFVFSI